MKKLKFKGLLFLSLFIAYPALVSAYSFSAQNDDGVTIYYNITTEDDGNPTVEVTYYDENYNSYSATSIVIPEEVTYTPDDGEETTYTVTGIGKYAFENCTSLGSITIPSGVESIGTNAFYNCSGLTSITIPSGVETISSSAFSGCSNIAAVTYNAKNCANFTSSPFSSAASSLTTVIIGENVEYIPEYLFYNCSNIATVTFNAKNAEFDTSPTTSRPFYSAGSTITTVTIGESVESIPHLLFSGCSNLATINYNAVNCADFTSSYPPFSGATSSLSVTIGDEVKSIPAYMFYFCTVLETLTMNSEALETIGSYAFYNCNQLTGTLTLPSTLTSIGEQAFFDCSNLTTLTLPSTLASIGTYAFYGCSSLENIENLENTAITTIPNYAFYNCSSLTSVGIPSGVESFGTSAFGSCTSIATVTYNAVNCADFTSAASRPFLNAQSTITNVTIGEGVQHIPAYLFDGCSALETVTISDNSQLTSIGTYAFYNCSSISSITIPSGVETIGDYAFYYCSAIETVNYNAVNCADFTSSIYSRPFYGARSSLTTVTIGNEVEYIPACLFYGCTALTSIEIPASVTKIGEYAFYGCTKLASVYYPSTTPAECGTNVFQEISSSRVLYVVYGYESLYSGYSESDDYAWNYFTNVKAGWLPIDVNAEDDNDDNTYYATYYNSQYAYTMPDNTKGATVTVSGNKLSMNWKYQAGETVPANTPLLLTSDYDIEDFYATVVYDDEVEDTDENMLHGSDTTLDAAGMESKTVADSGGSAGDYVYYKLAYNTDDEDLGFYWGEDKGAAFDVPSANKAWLAVPADINAKLTGCFVFGDSANDNETTGIASIESSNVSETANGVIYNLAGQRVNDMNRRGVYIVNGKKVVKN